MFSGIGQPVGVSLSERTGLPFEHAKQVQALGALHVGEPINRHHGRQSFPLTSNDELIAMFDDASQQVIQLLSNFERGHGLCHRESLA